LGLDLSAVASWLLTEVDISKFIRGQ